MGLLIYGGGGGIRTHGTRKGTTVFETVPIDHSGTPPRGVCAPEISIKTGPAGQKAADYNRHPLASQGKRPDGANSKIAWRHSGLRSIDWMRATSCGHRRRGGGLGRNASIIKHLARIAVRLTRAWR